jgi:hypothetical protein
MSNDVIPTDEAGRIAVDSDSIKAQMKQSLDVLAAVALPDEFDKPFSESHLIMWSMLIASAEEEYVDEAIFDQFALGLPRGHAKTTMLKLFVLYLVLFTKRRFIAVLCSNFTKAESFIEDVILLLNSDNIVTLFGRWDSYATKDNAKVKKFKFNNRRVILKPLGVGGSIRGISEDLRRPDIIICDDIQEREDAANLEQAEKLLAWFAATLMLARDLRICTMVYLGNMYKDLEIGKRDSGIYACLLRNLQRSSDWTSMIVGAILADGTALWEEVVSLKALLKQLRQDSSMGLEDSFFAELQNDPTVKMSQWYNPALVPDIPYNDYDAVIGKFIVIDPSLGTKKSDSQAVGLFYVYDERGPLMQEVRIIQESAPNLVKAVIDWCLEEGVPLVAGEAVAYQGTLLQWFIWWCDEGGIEGINFVGVTPKGFSKASRILAYFKSLMAGQCMCSRDAQALVDAQASLYKPTSAKNVDDILDLGAYSEQVFLEHAHDFLLPLEAEYKRASGSKKQSTFMPTVGKLRLK